MENIEELQKLSMNLFLKDYSKIEDDKKSIVNRFSKLHELSQNLSIGEIEYWKLSDDEKQAFDKSILDKYISIEMFKVQGDYFEVIIKCFNNNEFNENYYPVLVDGLIKSLKIFDEKTRNLAIATGNFLSPS